MAGRYAVDTNVAIALLNGEPGLVQRFNDADEILLPIPVLGELRYGALHSGNATANLAKVEDLAQDCRLSMLPAMSYPAAPSRIAGPSSGTNIAPWSPGRAATTWGCPKAPPSACDSSSTRPNCSSSISRVRDAAPLRPMRIKLSEER